MADRRLKIVRNSHPVTAVCESCEQTFMSRSEDAEQADKEIRIAFDMHTCKRRESTEGPKSSPDEPRF
jgi:hypothetical protein